MLYKMAAESLQYKDPELEKDAFWGSVLKFGLKGLQRIGSGVARAGSKFMKSPWMSDTLSAATSGFGAVKQKSQSAFNTMDSALKKRGINPNYKHIMLGAGATALGGYGAYRLGKAVFGSSQPQQYNPYMNG